MSQAVPQPTLLPAVEGATELLLIRHGRSADVVPGSPESHDPPLHDRGVEQARRLAERLVPKTIDAVYSSHLRRAVDTATPIAAGRGLDVRQRPDLREVELGDWGEGEFRRRALERDPEWVRFAESGRWDLVPGSVGDDAFRARVCGAVGEIARTHAGGVIAVVCHGGVINAYLAAMHGMHASFFCAIENTSVTVVRVGPHGDALLAVNDCHHLYDPVVEGPPAA